MDLAEFLKARLGEDEAAAKACQSPAPWEAATHAAEHWIVTDSTGQPVIYDEGTPSLEEAAHIARHDPARVLREVAAARADLDDYEQQLRLEPAPGTPDNRVQRQRDMDAAIIYALHKVIQRRAAVYSGHPAYPKDWRPPA